MKKVLFLILLTIAINKKSYSQLKYDSKFSFTHSFIESTILNDSVKLVISLPKNVLTITHYNHASMFAAYYLKNNNTTKAMELMTYYTNTFPKEARPYNVLGNVYEKLKDKKKAKMYYQKAIDLGEKNEDHRLSEYKHSLKQLNGL